MQLPEKYIPYPGKLSKCSCPNPIMQIYLVIPTFSSTQNTYHIYKTKT